MAEAGYVTDSTPPVLDDQDNVKIAIIDCGSRSCRVGFAGDDAPCAVFPSIVCRRNNPGVDPSKDCYVGHEANEAKSKQSEREILTIKCPIESGGLITNWDDMEKIWHHAFYEELRVTTEKTFVLLSECVMNPKANRERMTQVMVEMYNVPMLYICSSPVLSLYASGLSTGVVIDSGDSLTYVMPIYDGFVMAHAVQKTTDGGGRNLTQFLEKLLTRRGYSFDRYSYGEIKETLSDIKETLCRVALDFSEEISLAPLALTAHATLADTCVRVELTNLSGTDLCVLDMEMDSTLLDLQTQLLSKFPDRVGGVRMQLPNGLDLGQLKPDYALQLFGDLTEASFYLHAKDQEPLAPTWVVMPPRIEVFQAPDPSSKVLCMASLTVHGTQQGDWLRLSRRPGFIRIVNGAGIVEVVEEGKHLQKTYELNDGQLLTTGIERFLCPEAFFQPHLLDSDGRECCGLHELTARSIKRCDEKIHKDLYSHIVLAGGNAMFTGLAERMVKELKALAPAQTDVKVTAPKKWSAWSGGSLFAMSELRQHPEKWITTADYDEVGPELVHSKCPDEVGHD